MHQKGGFGQNELAVRMPTPVECERLQGFPDNRTLVPYKGGWMSDTQRYKQTGNAVTVDVIEHIFKALKRYLDQTKQPLHGATLVAPPPKHYQSMGAYVAYYATYPKKGFSHATQKAIVQHFAVEDQATILTHFIETNLQNREQLLKAITYCKQHDYTLIVANLRVLDENESLILKAKEQLGNAFIICDLPRTDRLSIAIALAILERNKLLARIKSQQVLKGNVKVGNSQNFTAATRKLGRLTYQAKVANDPKRKKLVAVIKRCRAEGMSFGQIAKELNAK